MKTIRKADQESYGKREWTRIINGLSGPKSANLIGTVSEDGTTNVSVVSSVFHLGASPPLMGFILRPHSNKSPRHTLLNIEQTGQYTINHIHESFFKKAHQSSARYPRKVSEFEACELKEVFKENCRAPFVGESNVQIGLKLLEVKLITQNKTQLVIGEIETIHLKPEILRPDGSLDLSVAGSLAVTGLDEYHKLRSLARLSYAKPDEPPTEIS